MRGDEFLDALGEINEAYILEAAEYETDSSDDKKGSGTDRKPAEYKDETATGSKGAEKNTEENTEEHTEEKNMVRKGKWWKWAAIAAGLLLAAGVTIGFMLRNPGKKGPNDPGAPSGGSNMHGDISDETGETVTIPAVLYDPKEDYGTSDMIALVVYHGGIYTYTYAYEGEEAQKIKELMGECVGVANGGIDEWSDPSAYEEELAGTVNGFKIYTVKGYDPEFRLCYEVETPEEMGGGSTIIFLERLNGITLAKGKELFEDRLHISENVEKIRWVSHASWNMGGKAQEEAAISPELWSKFLSEVDQAGFVDMFTPFKEDTKNDIYNTEQAHLTLQMKDGTVILLRLFTGGYVGYDGLGWYFAKLPGETFDQVFALAKGE